MANDWDTLVNQVGNILEVKENYQKTLGQLAATVVHLYGRERLADFAEEIKETHGILVAPSTLRNYVWVWDKTASLGLPEDLSYRTLQTLASMKDVKTWAERIIKDGLGSSEAYKLMMLEKYPDGRPKKTTICKSCGASVEI